MDNQHKKLYRSHSRLWRENRFVYPVLSRRSKGVSLGVNLNPDKICNFDCIYCQVNRRSNSETRFVEMKQLLEELHLLLGLVVDNELFQEAGFSNVPQNLQRLNDIAFSGDGEPTTYKNFDEIIQQVADVKQKHSLNNVKMVLITNASMFHRPVVQRGLELFDANNGEVWAKLDAGTEAYFKKIEQTTIPFSRILDNITAAAQVRPLVIQTLFMNVKNVPPSPNEIAAYCQRLNDVIAAGGKIKLVQIYTVARPPAQSNVTSLSNQEVDAIVSEVEKRCHLNVEAYYGQA
ncbi:Radical SAM domain protein [hydrothermal vent metagenome]|uniref:Radical SAM domain protein n=1 Tax=hydrothermal vent metagenome TaxID=652676 RepID=A0A3B1D2Z7_9ZZZZ